MKRFIHFLFFFLLINTFGYSQIKEVRAYLIKRDSVLESIAQNQVLDQEDSLYFTILQSSKPFTKFKSNEFDHSAVGKHHILIQFLDNNGQLLKLNQANIASISIFKKDIPPSSIDGNLTYLIIPLREFLKDEPSNGEQILLNIKTHTGLNENRWFNYINGIQPYNFANNGFGLWFPVNMYSSSFKRSENGVLFTAMPIGLALGAKYNISQKFYIGLSGTFNYTLAEASGDSIQSKSYFLQDITFGPLVDLGGYAYFGYTFPFNLTNKPSDLSPQFVVGIGVRITELLKGK